jgi:Actin
VGELHSALVCWLWTHPSITLLIGVGYGDRLLNEVKRMKDGKIKIYAPPERKYSTWIGGSILAGLNTFKRVGLSSDVDVVVCILIGLRCGYRQKSIKKIQTLSIRNLDFDVRILHLLLTFLCGVMARYPGIFIAVLLSVCIQGSACQICHAAFASMHMCIFMVA